MHFLTIPQVAKRLDRSASFVYREIRKGSLMPTHYGNQLHVRPHVLARYLETAAAGSASAGRRSAAAKRAARRGPHDRTSRSPSRRTRKPAMGPATA